MKLAGFDFKKVDAMTGRELFCVERLRSEVFVTEQGITLPELDDEDLLAVQVFKLNAHATDAVATCRIFQEDGRWQLGRVVVAKKQRETGLGTRLMRAVHAYLRMRGVDRLRCHAQVSAKSFYEKLGYETEGEPFDEGGIQHVLMVKSLR